MPAASLPFLSPPSVLVFVGKLVKSFKDHRHYVQGVAWDPLNQYFCTQSCDRVVRLWKIQEKLPPPSLTAQVSPIGTKKLVYSLQAKLARDTRTERALFLDDSLVTFFRRPTWSPDGAYLIMPAAQRTVHSDPAQAQSQSQPQSQPLSPMLEGEGYGFVIASRQSLVGTDPHGPVLRICQPGLFNKPPIVIKCCPLMFPIDPARDNPSRLPYRHLFAVATRTTLHIYDTQLPTKPLRVYDKLHYALVADLSWSRDGLSLFVSSQDGFCSLIKFEDEGELAGGPALKPEERERHLEIIRKHYRPFLIEPVVKASVVAGISGAGAGAVAAASNALGAVNASTQLPPPSSDIVVVSIDDGDEGGVEEPSAKVEAIAKHRHVNVLPVKRKLVTTLANTGGEGLRREGTGGTTAFAQQTQAQAQTNGNSNKNNGNNPPQQGVIVVPDEEDVEMRPASPHHHTTEKENVSISN